MVILNCLIIVLIGYYGSQSAVICFQQRQNFNKILFSISVCNLPSKVSVSNGRPLGVEDRKLTYAAALTEWKDIRDTSGRRKSGCSISFFGVVRVEDATMRIF